MGFAPPAAALPVLLGKRPPVNYGKNGSPRRHLKFGQGADVFPPLFFFRRLPLRLRDEDDPPPFFSAAGTRSERAASPEEEIPDNRITHITRHERQSPGRPLPGPLSVTLIPNHRTYPPAGGAEGGVPVARNIDGGKIRLVSALPSAAT